MSEKSIFAVNFVLKCVRPARRMSGAILCFSFAVLPANTSSGQSASFQRIGDLPGGSFDSFAADVSADGTVVTGYGSGVNGREAIKWTQDTGIVGLGDLAGDNFESIGRGVSQDGSTIVGEGTSDEQEAFMWSEQTGMQGLGTLDTGLASRAYDVSDNGLVVVGASSPDSSFDDVAVRWINGSIQSLGILPGNDHSEAYGTSADGASVVGYSFNGDTPAEAFEWTAASGIVGLGDLAGGSFSSHAWGISADGEVIVGDGTDDTGQQAVIWPAAGGMISVGPGTFSAVSGDGTTAVGRTAPVQEATVWTEETGLIIIKTVLEDEGLDLDGWSLFEATGVSFDGTTIVGYGRNPDGSFEGWVATLPRKTNWTNALGGTFTDETNWSGNTVPDASIIAVFDTSASYTVSIDENVASASLVVKENDVELDVLPESHYAVGSLVVDDDVSSTSEASLTVSSGILIVDGDIAGAVVADQGKGSITIENGGWLNVEESLALGLSPGSEAEVSVDGVGSQITVSGDLFVGDVGSATVNVTNGALMIAESGATIGLEPGSSGDVLVDGPGTEWINMDSVWVGYEGSGGFVIQNGADVIMNAAILGWEGSGIGSVQVDGANSLLTVNGPLGIGLSGTGLLKLINAGAVEAQEVAIGTLGSLDITGGTIVVGGSPLNSSKTGLGQHPENTTNGVLRADRLFIEDGAEILADSLEIREDAVVGGSGTFPFSYTNSGIVSPGSAQANIATLTMGSDYDQTSTGTLSIELGGPVQDVDHDKLLANGTVELAGTLEVNLVDDYSPDVGNRFEIIVAGAVSGTFDSVVTQDGLEVDVSYESTSVTIEVTKTVSTEEGPATDEAGFVLHQNYPNPSSSSTIVGFKLSMHQPVELAIHDLTGRQIYIVILIKPAGHHEVEINTAAWPAGTYMYSAKVGDLRYTRKLIVVQ